MFFFFVSVSLKLFKACNEHVD